MNPWPPAAQHRWVRGHDPHKRLGGQGHSGQLLMLFISPLSWCVCMCLSCIKNHKKHCEWLCDIGPDWARLLLVQKSLQLRETHAGCFARYRQLVLSWCRTRTTCKWNANCVCCSIIWYILKVKARKCLFIPKVTNHNCLLMKFLDLLPPIMPVFNKLRVRCTWQ